MKKRALLTLMLALPLCACGADPAAGGKPTQQPPITNPPMDSKTQTATLAAGCFWCTEAVLQRIKGVEKIVSGYIGGTGQKPDLRRSLRRHHRPCRGRPGDIQPGGHQLRKLLEVFWQLHDPTTLNRQGPDEGTQYRSAIFFHSEEQQKLAEASKKKHQADFKSPIVTEITKASVFYPAENYHQNYFNLNKNRTPTAGS